MYLIFVIILCIIFAIFYVDWDSWKCYYPTITFYISMDLLVNFLYYNYSLFTFNPVTTSFLNHTIIQIAFTFLIMPIVILIFLQKQPRKIRDKIFYVLIWSLFFISIEYFFQLKGLYVYSNGWNIWHSLWFDVMMFTIFILHYKNPLLSICLTVVGGILFLLNFPIPFDCLK